MRKSNNENLLYEGARAINGFVAITNRMRHDGGPGSGNFGHAGRPGEIGGSAPGDGSGEVNLKGIKSSLVDGNYSSAKGSLSSAEVGTVIKAPQFKAEKVDNHTWQVKSEGYKFVNGHFREGEQGKTYTYTLNDERATYAIKETVDNLSEYGSTDDLDVHKQTQSDRVENMLSSIKDYYDKGGVRLTGNADYDINKVVDGCKAGDTLTFGNTSFTKQNDGRVYRVIHTPEGNAERMYSSNSAKREIKAIIADWTDGGNGYDDVKDWISFKEGKNSSK